jgi:hypothetical protein
MHKCALANGIGGEGELCVIQLLRDHPAVCQRDVDIAFGNEHDVILMEQATTEYGRGFEVIGLAKEHELLTGSAMSRCERDERILELNGQGKSMRDIAELLNMGKSRVHDIIKGARS